MVLELQDETQIFCHFGSFGKNVKNTWRYYPFTSLYHEWRSYDAWFLGHKAQQTEFFVIWGQFLSFDPPNNWKKSKFWKNEKGAWRYYPFTLVYHRWQSYDVSLLRCAVRQTNFCYFGLLFSLLPPTNCGNQNFEKMKKKCLEILSFYTCEPQMKIIWSMVPKIWTMIDKTFLVILDHIWPF